MRNENTKEKIQKKREIWRKTRLKERKKYEKQNRIYLRCTENEKNFMLKTISELDTKKTLTEYILECALYSNLYKIDFSNLRDLTTAVNRLNNNINQIARDFNIAIKSIELDQNILVDIKQKLESYNDQLQNISLLTEQQYRRVYKTISHGESIDYNSDIVYGKNMDMCPCRKDCEYE